MMVLLEEKSLTARDKFQPERLSLQLTERTSTATMTVGPGAPEMTVGDWMKMEDGPAAGIVWRIKSIDDQMDTETRTVSLEHIINTLKDRIIIDEVKPEYISGREGVNPTNGDTARFILENWQSTWVLGGVADGEVRNPYSFNGENLYSALEKVSGAIEDCFWHYDMSKYPFRVDLVYLSRNVVSEMRTDRNIRTLRRTIDRTGMYTRIFPIGKNDLRISGGSISMNTEIYGAIHKTETDQSLETEEALYWWAYNKLRKHCYPVVTITISGLDLAEATGEELDKLRVGYMCRVPLPEYNTTIIERVTKLSYTDVIGEPENVTVTMSNRQEDTATITSVINSMASSASGAGRAAATKAGEDHAWFEDTEEHVAMVAEAIIGTDEDGVDWSRVSSVVVDGEGIHQRVVKAQGDIIANEAKIDINEKRILQEVTDRTKADGELTGRITVQADRITQEVVQRKGDVDALSGRITVEAGRISQEVRDRTNADTALGGRITVEAGRISQIVSAVGADGEVSAASIVLAINNAGESEAHIDAGKVYIGNQKSTTVINGKLNASDVTADYVATKLASATNVNVKRLTLTGNGYIVLPNGPDGNVTITGANAYDFIRQLQIVQNGNTYKLQKKTQGDMSNWQDVGSFSRAVSSWLVGGGNGKVKVTASPQNQFKEVPVSISGSNAITVNGSYTYKVMYENADGDDVETGATMDVTVNVPGTVSSWVVSGGGGKVRVTAQPQGQGKSVPVSISGSNYITSNGTYTYKVMYEDDGGDDVETGATLEVEIEVYPNSIEITRASWHSTSGNVYKGRLYYWDDDDGSYQPVVNGNYYWYYSDDSKSGTTTVHY